MSSEKELKAKRLRKIVEHIYAWKEADMMAFDEEQNRELGRPVFTEMLRDAVTRRDGELSPIEMVLIKRGLEESAAE